MTSTSWVLPVKVDWGDWVLGDLSLVMARVADLLGQSTAAVRVMVEFPVSWAVPTVEVQLEDADDVDQALNRARGCWEPVEVLEVNPGQAWYARLRDLELVVTLPHPDKPCEESGVGSC